MALVVMGCLVGLLVWAGWNSLHCTVAGAKKSRAESDLQSLGSALRLFQRENGRFPTEAEGLRALVESPDSTPPLEHWRKLMDREALDPWGRPYRYSVSLSDHGTRGQLCCVGEDGVVSDDDIVGQVAPFP